MASLDDFKIWLQRWRVSEWLVRFSCRWRSWRTGHGCMRGGCRWDVDGMGTALRRGMRVKLHRRKNCGSFAISAMRRVVDGCRRSGRGIRCGLRPGPCAEKGRTGLVGVFKFGTFASAGIVRRRMGRWSLMRRRSGGNSGIATAECSAWRSALWPRMLRRGKGRK
jgi:hypothetical protein